MVAALPLAPCATDYMMLFIDASDGQGGSMSERREEWRQPELVSVVRGRLEEAVLTACKDEAGSMEGPSISDRWCNSVDDGCPNCSSWTPS